MKLQTLLKAAYLALLVTLSLSQISQAQTANSNAKPCESRPEYRQFDFWIGEWEVEAPNGAKAGTNNVQLILGKCVIFENWVGARGMSGKSFSLFNTAKGKWQQTWVDDRGGVLEFIGEFKDGALRLQAEQLGQAGKKTLQRMTFTQLEGGRVRQFGENSQDDGKTWQTGYDLLYKKKATAANTQ